MKRLFDISVSVFLLLFLSPVMVLIGILVYAEDGGPFLFRQIRVGRGGSLFSMLKFRSMIRNAECTGGYSTCVADPRVTKVGRVIRRTSIDELPQLINVLFGDMSIVGPRPLVPQQCQFYTQEEWVMRHSVRPGITGLSQAKLRSQATHEQRTSMDLEYVTGPSAFLDSKIIALTIVQVFLKGGN